MCDKPFYPGDRVIVFDHLSHIDDKTTPYPFAWKPATVVCHYGYKSQLTGNLLGYTYPNVIDVVFDHRPNKTSKSHFADHIERI